MTPPTLGPEFTSSSCSLPSPSGELSIRRRPSFSSRRGRSSESILSTLSRTSSAKSIPFRSDDEVELAVEEGIKHVNSRLQAKRYKTLDFASDLLSIILALKVPTWSASLSLSPQNIKVFKVSGSMTNAVLFVSYPKNLSVKTLLLRIYGPSSSVMISRPRELRTLHVLSSKYHIGPRIYGTFENGRVEEYFDSAALTAAEIRDVKISRWIGARMAELHCVDIEIIEDTTPQTRGENVGWEIAARRNVRSWMLPAREILQMSSVSEDYKAQLNFDQFAEDWRRYMSWVEKWEKIHGSSKRVFAHNDTQYGNLLKRNDLKEGLSEHRRIIVVDFEFAAPNPAAFDIANHFHEWTANYHGPTPHLLDLSRYPNEFQRQNFYEAYLTHSFPPFATASVSPDLNGVTKHGGSESGCGVPLDLFAEYQRLEAQIKVWSPATHAMWAVWGIIQARDDLEMVLQAKLKGTKADEPEFDYLGYALCRVEGFRREIKALGI